MSSTISWSVLRCPRPRARLPQTMPNGRAYNRTAHLPARRAIDPIDESWRAWLRLIMRQTLGVSKDTGFDPLIQHLKSKKILAARWRDVTEIPLLKVSNAKSPAKKLAIIVEHLKARGAARPRKVKTLMNTISALFLKQVPDEELIALVGELQAKGFASVSDTNVSYSLPA